MVPPICMQVKLNSSAPQPVSKLLRFTGATSELLVNLVAVAQEDQPQQSSTSSACPNLSKTSDAPLKADSSLSASRLEPGLLPISSNLVDGRS